MSEATQAVEPVLEAASDAILEGVDTMEDAYEIVRNNPTVLVAVGVLAAIAGGVGGYFFAKKKLDSYYEDLAGEQIAEAKAFYAGVYKTDEDGEVLSPMDVLADRHGLEAAAEAARIYQGRQAATNTFDAENDDGYTEVEPGILVDTADEIQMARIEERTYNVFSEATRFDYATELPLRTPEKPYIITHEEYDGNEKGYEQDVLTYYSGDKTLADSSDEPINDADVYVGGEHLSMFGKGSRDVNTLYVRNERLSTEYEIVKSAGTYLEEVLGITEAPSGP